MTAEPAGGPGFDLEARELDRAEAEGLDRPPVEPRPAAGVILAREAADGPEVLLVRRRPDQGFAAGAYVFPGGALDPEDGDPRWREHAAGWNAHPPEVAAFVVAACRELFEETGVLLASGAAGSRRLHPGATSAMRRALASGRSFLELISGSGLALDLGRLAFCARWVTPVPLSRRYDARFFLAAVPRDAEVAAGAAELVEHQWIAPARALERHHARDLPMLFPTATTLEWLAAGASVENWFGRCRDARAEPLLPRLRRAAGAVRPVLPGTREYVEGALRVLVAPNPGPLTLDGTRTYVVGTREVVVIDPGPEDGGHLRAILEALPARGRLTAIAVTHAHPDHAAAATRLAAETGAPLCGSALTLERLGVTDGRALAPDDAIEFEGDALVTLAAPGHCADHVAFLWREAKALFCGDAILGTGSALVAPPDGDLGDYLHTLRRWAGLDLLVLYPGHGPPVPHAREKIQEYVTHRMQREAQVLGALRAGPATVAGIRARVYGRLGTGLARAAEANVEAHLKKLLREGRVSARAGGRYALRR